MRPPHLFFASSPWPENRTVAAAGCGLRAASCGLQLSVALVGCPRPTVQHCNTRASHLDHGVCCVFARSPCLCRSMVPETSEHSVGPSAVGACSEPRHRTLSSTIGSLSPLCPSHATLSYAFKGTSSSAHIFQTSRHLTCPDTPSVGSASRRAFLLASVLVVVVFFLSSPPPCTFPLSSGFCLLAPSRFHCRTTSSASLVCLLSRTYTCINSAGLSLFRKATIHPHDFICALARSSTSVTFILHHIAT